jgi:spermidine synthase
VKNIPAAGCYNARMYKETIVLDSITGLERYQVVDKIYNDRPARILYSGNRDSLLSGVALDDKSELLFDYNERFMELIRGLRPSHVLVIGGGAFTLPKAVNKEFPAISLDVVELDPELYEIAKKYFDYKPGKRTRVFIGDGARFLERLKKKYDLIIIDVFINTVIPPSFQTESLARNLRRALHKDGLAAMNIIASYHGLNSAILRRLAAVLRTEFQSLRLYPADHGRSLWLPQNFVITAQNDNRQPDPPIHFESIKLF